MSHALSLTERIAACDAVLAQYGNSQGAEPGVADALFEKGFLLHESARYEDAIACFDEIVVRLGEVEALELRRQVARALRAKGYALDALGRPDDARAAFGDVARRVGDDSDPELRGEAMRALYQEAHLLVAAGREAEALRVLATLLNPYADADLAADTLEIFAKGLVLSGKAASGVGDGHAAVQLYDDVVRRFGRRAEPEFRALVVLAMTNKATAIGISGRFEDAAQLLGETLARFQDPETPELRDRLVEALCGHGYWLEASGDKEQALVTYRDVLERFAEHESPVVDEQRARAREGIDALMADDAHKK